MNELPEKYILPQERIPKAFAQGPYRDCVAITFTKILEVINYIKTGEYTYLSKGYMYGRNNRPGKTQGGSDYEYMLKMLLSRGTVPEDLCPERDEIPCITEKLEKREDISKLDKVAEAYKIISWEKIEGNAYKLNNIKKYLCEYGVPLAGNMTGNTQHCTVIVGYDKDKLIYQDHNINEDLRTISHNKFNYAYYLNGGIINMSNFNKYSVEEFKKYMDSVKVARQISRVQLHHTWSPSYKHFTGKNHIELQQNMRSYHVNTNGWSDIAQHFTIFPDGIIVNGRSLEMIPAGIANANTGSICIECIGNFDKDGDTMNEAQKNAIAGAVKVLLDKFGLNAKTGVTYHAWWTNSGSNLGTYVAGKSQKTCPGTNFFGGSSREAYEKNLMPLIENFALEETIPQSAKPTAPFTQGSLKAVESINDIVWELANAKIITDSKLWIKKCEEDVNVYWLCRKMANYLRGTL